ncbi:MAG: DUF371 domain-containing protein [Promethearchaeia archaeon]
MKVLDTIEAIGHKNILCTHPSTIELTKEKDLTLNGDCILGVNATKACADLNEKLIECIHNGKKLLVQVKCGNLIDSFYGYGHEDLTLSHQHDIVFRTSDFICNRTLLIRCSKSAADIDRKLVRALRNRHNRLQLIIKRFKNYEGK